MGVTSKLLAGSTAPLLICTFGSAQFRNAVLIEAVLDGCYGDCPIIPLPNSYVFCFQEGATYYIGQHQSWSFGLKKLAGMEGKSLPFRADDSHLWVKLPNGFEIKLNQFNYEYPFKRNECRTVAQERSFEHGYTRPSPVPGEPAFPVMRNGLVFGWALCSAASTDRKFYECTVWDLKGEVRQQGPYEIAVKPRGALTTVKNRDETPHEAFTFLGLPDGGVLKRLELTAPTQ